VFHVKHEGWTPDSLPVWLSEPLERFEDLLRIRAIPAGLVARSDAGDLRERHVLDSLRGVALIPPATRDVADLGSGAGLPGVPLAIALPDVRFTLVDSRRRRIAFLELVVEELPLPNVTVLASRAEELRLRFDVCVARGFASAAATWKTAERLLHPAGRLLYWAGTSFDPGDVPEGAKLEGLGEPALESGGPIAIMARQ
jgi:16S rRNA (guanine527-N7)-methyltransferase